MSYLRFLKPFLNGTVSSLEWKSEFQPSLKLQWNSGKENQLPVINDCDIRSRNPQDTTTLFQLFLANLSLIVIIS